VRTLAIEIDGCVWAAIVTVTSAVLDGSATEVTVMVAVPALTPVITQPGLVTVATAVLLDEQVTPAAISAAEPDVNVEVIDCVCVGESVIVDGETEIAIGVRVTVSVAVADFVGSPVEVAVITVTPALRAVTLPVASTVATVGSDDVKVFAVLALPVTVETNVKVLPTSMLAVAGVIVMTVLPGLLPPTTVMIDAAVFVGSAAEVAVMTAVPFFCVAVTTPAAETVATVASDVE
jgi:hypothetical protein